MTRRAWGRGVRAALGVLGALLACCSAAHAAGYATDDRGNLYQVFPDAREVTRVGVVRVPASEAGPAEVPALTDLALHDEHGMYGISYTHLYRIDVRDPGRSVRVGALGVPATCNALAFDEDGTLYLAGSTALYRVDRTTGRATRIGDFGIAGFSDGDLAWVEDKLYGTVSSARGCLLVIFDVKTGKATPVGVVRTARKRVLDAVWGLIFDGRTLWALTPAGEVFALDRGTALATPRFMRPVRFWGACPMLRI